MADRTVTCQECNKVFEAKPRGKLPSRCPECRDAEKKARLKSLHDSRRKPDDPTTYDLSELSSFGTPQPVVAKVEDSWLDEPEVQEQLAERRADEFVDIEPYVDFDREDPPPKPRDPDAPPAFPYSQPAADLPVDLRGLDIKRVEQPEEQEEEVPGYVQPSSCVGPGCLGPVEHAGRYCTGHWLRIDLDTRQVLLGAERGSEPYNAAATKAARRLRANP